MASGARRIPFPARLGYASGSLGAGIYSTVPGILLLYFMTQELHLAVPVASLVVLVPKLAVVILDPAIGAWSDGLDSRWGRRRPFLLAGALTSGLFFVTMFAVPADWTATATALAMGLAYFCASATYSIFAVPYVAMPAELSTDPSVQSELIGLRMVFVFFGVLAGAALAPVLVDTFGGGRAGYLQMALALAALSTLVMLVTTFASPPPERQTPVARPARLRDVTRFFAYPPFLLGVGLYAVAITAIGVASAAAPYFVTFTLLRPESDIALIFLSQILTSLLVMMIWAKITPRIGAAMALSVAAAIGAAGFAGFRTLGADTPDLAIIMVSAVSGIGVGGIQVGAFALLAQLTGELNARLSGRHEGVLTGIWTATEKLALALGPAICGLVLSVGRFESGQPADALPESALAATGWAMAVAPTTILALGIVLALSFRARLAPRDSQATG